MPFRVRGKRSVNKKAKSKFGNEFTGCALGHSHRSKLEASVCQILQLREKAKEIKILQAEDHIYLTKAKIGYIPDFKCLDLITRQEFWVEAKGFETDVWPIKKKLWRHYGPGRLEIWKGDYRNPTLVEEILPKLEE